MDIAERIHDIRATLPNEVKLIAVSKFHGPDLIKEAYNAGQLLFGESRVQELHSKYLQLPNNIEWHFIGHLQTNKVKQLLPYVDTIHSVDSWKLLSEIDKFATIIRKRVCCLLEIHIAQEESKFGMTFDECRNFLAEKKWSDCKFAYIGGLMGMASNIDDNDQIRKEFRSLKDFFEEIKNDYFIDDEEFSDISMGMSHDYKIAVEEGTTMVRIGSSIFGER